MRYLIFIILLPLAGFAQGFEFELQPEAFPVEINGWHLYAPWAGGINNSTPEFCDIDGDGDLDYFSGSAQNLYWFFENDGSFSSPNFEYVSSNFDSLHPICPGAAYESDLDFCDIDADGDFDALMCNGIIGLAVNSGSNLQRNFTTPSETLFTTSHQYLIATNFAAADIDADDDIDIFAGTWYAGGIALYQNIGTPQNYQFTLVTENWQNVQIPSKGDPTFADLDADGDLDLLIGTGNGTIYYYRNDGTPQVPQMTLVTNNYFGIDVGADASPELADIDGDGDLDLFVGRSHWANGAVSSGDVYFYLNTGTAQVSNFQLITTNYLTWNSGDFAMPRLIDIDADGDPDLFSSRGYQILLYRNQGTLHNPHFVWETDNFENITTPGACVPWFCDIDSDGDYDLFVGPGEIPGPPGLYFYRNQGTPQTPNFVLESTNLVPGVFTQASVVLFPYTTDIDGDGDQDLFVRDNPGNFYFFRNVGTPTHFQFQFISNNWQNLYDWCANYMCFYDIDRDGDQDLFVDHVGANYWDWGLRFYRNVGTPQNAIFQLETQDIFPQLMIISAAPCILDMDRDGDGDLFVGDQWGGIRYFKNVTGDSTAVLQPTKMRPRPSRATLSIGPNPSNPITSISYQLSAVSIVNLSVYDISGRRVAQLVNGRQNPGDYSVNWNATGNASGVYLVRLTTPEEEIAQKVVVLK